jgi:hypothetical protein
VGISGLPLGSPKIKWHLGASLVAKHRVYYKGEGGGFPKFEPWWVLWVQVCMWFVLNSAMHFFVIFTLDSHLYLSRSLGARQFFIIICKLHAWNHYLRTPSIDCAFFY